MNVKVSLEKAVYAINYQLYNKNSRSQILEAALKA